MRKVIILAIILSSLGIVLCGQAGGKGHFDRAMALYRDKMWSAAQVEFRKARQEITQPVGRMDLMCDYMIAMCAANAGDDNAKPLLEDFLEKYPYTIYRNDVQMALSGEYYRLGDYQTAMQSYLGVDPFDLPQDKRDEYRFKLGHCYFLTGDRQAAYNSLRQVDRKGDYGAASIYYQAYMDYTSGDYGAARQGFSTLSSDALYGPIVPFYLLQIEFLEGNYNYVTHNGDALVASATKPRATEILRLMGESWYHLGDHAKALSYVQKYKSLGGMMGREESYIEGYCLYMTGAYKQASVALAAACGTDDALSQNAGYHLADCYIKLGDKRLAMQSFSIASVGTFDQSIREDALFNYGKLQYELGGGVFNEAINVLNRYIKEYPSSSRINQAREYLLAAYYNSRNYEGAWDAIQLINNPDNNVKAALQKISYFRALEYYNNADYEKADNLLGISARNRFNSKYTALADYWRGEIAFRRGDFKNSAALYRQYITLSPKSEVEHATANYSLAYSYFNMKQWDESQQWFDRFLALQPSSNEYRADVYNRLGDIQYSRHAFWPALEEYNKAAKLNTEQKYYSEWRRAVLLGLVDRVPGKIDALKEIVATDRSPYKEQALYELGRTYMYADNYKDAASTFTRYINSYPAGASYTDALSDLALTYQNMGDNDRAMECYKKIVASSPGTAQAKDAMMSIRGIYVDKNDVESYFSYAAATGMESDLSAIHRDSLSFASAERLYLTGSNPGNAATALRNYLNAYPKGAYRLNALFDLGDAAIRAGDRNASKLAYKELADMNYNNYTVRSLQNLSRMQEEDKNYPEAFTAYQRLSRTANEPAVIDSALEGYLRMAKHVPSANPGQVADEVLESPYAGATVTRQANFEKAKALDATGKKKEALAIYEKLSGEVQSAEGAESAYRVIESLFFAGNNAKAKELVFALSAKNSPHAYWVGKSFLILGDIYSKEGDRFQARATYQSIVDGYSTKGDGIIDAARERIKELK